MESGSEEEEEAVDSEDADEAEESKMHRLLGLKKALWRAKRKLLQVQRRVDLRSVEKKILELRQRRAARRAIGDRPDLRRRRRNSVIDRPKRGIDRCWGCAKPFFAQVVRRWRRCDACGLWLCPECSSNPVHCQRDPMI